jgi:hypothetical protein
VALQAQELLNRLREAEAVSRRPAERRCLRVRGVHPFEVARKAATLAAVSYPLRVIRTTRVSKSALAPSDRSI